MGCKSCIRVIKIEWIVEVEDRGPQGHVDRRDEDKGPQRGKDAFGFSDECCRRRKKKEISERGEGDE